LIAASLMANDPAQAPPVDQEKGMLRSLPRSERAKGVYPKEH
jgi:hypothetical protein